MAVVAVAAAVVTAATSVQRAWSFVLGSLTEQCVAAHSLTSRGTQLPGRPLTLAELGA